jgi:hypothetical protein
VAIVIDDADSAEIPAATVELEVGRMFSSLFPDRIALGAKVKAAVEVKTSVLEINATIKVKVKAAAGVNAAVEVNTFCEGGYLRFVQGVQLLTLSVDLAPAKYSASCIQRAL